MWVSAPSWLQAGPAIVASSTSNPRPASRPPRKAGTTAATYVVAGARWRGQTRRERASSGDASTTDGTVRSASSACTCAQAWASARSGSWATGAVRTARRPAVAAPSSASRSSTTTSTSHGISRLPLVVAGVSSHGRWAPASSTNGNRFGSASASPSTGSVRTTCPAARAATSAGPRSWNPTSAGSWTPSTVSRAVTLVVCCRGTPAASTVPSVATTSPRCVHGANVTSSGAVTSPPRRAGRRSPPRRRRGRRRERRRTCRARQ